MTALVFSSSLACNGGHAQLKGNSIELTECVNAFQVLINSNYVNFLCDSFDSAGLTVFPCLSTIMRHRLSFFPSFRQHFKLHHMTD